MSSQEIINRLEALGANPALAARAPELLAASCSDPRRALQLALEIATGRQESLTVCGDHLSAGNHRPGHPLSPAEAVSLAEKIL